MPVLPCPNCGHLTPRRLDGPSDFAQVNYYHCYSCTHTWNTPKARPGDPPIVVAQGRKAGADGPGNLA